jgi:hypothetical protein
LCSYKKVMVMKMIFWLTVILMSVMGFCLLVWFFCFGLLVSLQIRVNVWNGNFYYEIEN